jgi:AraC family transcriptional regulator, positive regulator of tynA and feaB
MKTVQRWSTNDIAPDRRLRFWRDAVHQSLVEMDLKPHGHSPTFESSIEACQLASLAPHQAKGSAQTVHRGLAEIARGQKNAYYLLSQPAIPWRIKHAGQDAMVEAGESVLIDSREPYEFIFAEGLDDLSIEMPIDWVERWLPHPGDLLGQPLQCQNGWGKALRGFKEALVPQSLLALSVPDTMIEEQLGVLLSLAAEPLKARTGKAGTGAGYDLVQCCIQAMREHLSDPGLVAGQIAEACGLSVRSLHRVFSATDKTFASELMHIRIAEAARMLGSRRFDTLNVSEVSRRCGFSDPSHFARQFRMQRGMAPRDYPLAVTGDLRWQSSLRLLLLPPDGRP